MPKENNVHEVAQRAAPESRVVYVDRDPIVLAHAHALLRGTPEGATRYIYGELREPEAILRASAETLDFTRPAAVLLFGILHFFSEDDDPSGIVRRAERHGGVHRKVQVVHESRIPVFPDVFWIRHLGKQECRVRGGPMGTGGRPPRSRSQYHSAKAITFVSQITPPADSSVRACWVNGSANKMP